MARASAAIGGNTGHEWQNADELEVTKAELDTELKKLVNKIGIVNVLALMYGLNESEITDIYNPYHGHYTAHGWFSLKNGKASAVNVDSCGQWRERWCEIPEIRFGQK